MTSLTLACTLLARCLTGHSGHLTRIPEAKGRVCMVTLRNGTLSIQAQAVRRSLASCERARSKHKENP